LPGFERVLGWPTLAYDRSVARLRGVITDWGGVMTNPISDTVNAWLAAERIDRVSYAGVMRLWLTQAYADGQDHNPVHALERGECTNAEFELALASQLVLEDGGPVAGPGLLTRMFAGSRLDEAMVELFRRLHADGVPTAMLSNSWGGDYPRELFPGMFDAVVISAEVGMRKPETRIFLHAAEMLGLAPEECIFVDDIRANIAAAEQSGFTCVLHTQASLTAKRLAELLKIQLAELS
jgi:epoxide hydrolase-like predicted phosphatase